MSLIWHRPLWSTGFSTLGPAVEVPRGGGEDSPNLESPEKLLLVVSSVHRVQQADLLSA